MKQVAQSLKRTLNAARWRSIETICDFNPQENLIISSDPRGGSNWLAESIAQVPKTAILVEPLNLHWASRFRELEFCWRQYIPEFATWEEARQAFALVFCGKALYGGVGVQSSPRDFVRADRMVIKFCRVKAILPWLVQNFEFNYKPVNLVRHPCAVVASQRQASFKFEGWSEDNFNGFVIPDCPYNEFYTRHADFLATITTKEEELTTLWCMTNEVLLQHPRNNIAWLTVFYEDLLLQPEAEMRRIFDTWDLPIPQSIWKQMQTPSATAIETTFQQSTEEQLAKWRSVFTPDQLARMENVLNYFEVTTYTLDDAVPHVAVASE